ncbi:MAG: ABC transporter ATP-binding protein [Bacteroidetes bacterium CG02_land_8_20_14_3_00_31_25]|nr:MAG: ABC transporter ATP-binding protein [Bacteroidetes bacterium CG02_land_8_20_14_3_00_31_25]PIX32877.1 MAG: ABC transporter ATP-binding protein [Bacteroidetes bacterium CG_4_8_14_3_um_filter_31_14]PIY02804.1 MAG: ABC transporter ATP-binding protein [Bacteroidetes bacterium CG_4_10_14_3_um_filter_31_20]
MLLKRFPYYHQHDAMDCGPACLRMLSNYYGKKYRLETLIDLSFYTRKGISLKGLSYAAESIGFKTIGVNTSYNKLVKEQPDPFIIYWKQNHFFIVYKITKKYVLVADSAIGKYKLKKDEFINGWAGTVENNIAKGICLLLEPLPIFYENKDESKVKDITSFKFLLSYIRPYKKFMFQLFLGLLFGTLLQLIFPFLMQSLVDVGVKRQDIPFIYLLLLANFVLLISSSFVGIIRSWILLHISTRVNISLISDFLIKLMKLPMSYFETKMTGDIKQRIDDHNRIETFLTSNTINILFSFLNIIIFSIVLGIYSTKILAVFYIGAGVYITWVTLFLKKRRKLDILRFGQSSDNQNNLYRLITNMQEIKLHNAEQQKRWEWENLQAKIFKLNVKQLSLSQMQSSGGVFVTGILLMLITVISATSVIKGEITLGMMLSIQYIIGQMNSPIEQAINFINSYQDARLSIERLAEVHLRKNEEQEDTSFGVDDIKSRNINISNLTFQYEGPYSPKVLENVNLAIDNNKVTALVGVSGSGKTTIMKLLLGFYKPTEGEISVGEISLNNIKTSEWRSVVGAVMQDGVIFSDTIANNITIGCDNIDTELLKYSAKMADIHDFIMSLPLKYNTKVGDDGSGLSQGQKQRLLIARAIYKKPQFVFFDEATNALDTKSEKTIVENMKEFFRNKTVLVIAHRLSTVKNADKIIVLDKGKIVEQGTHHYLTEKKGVYYQLIQNQLEMG